MLIAILLFFPSKVGNRLSRNFNDDISFSQSGKKKTSHSYFKVWVFLSLKICLESKDRKNKEYFLCEYIWNLEMVPRAFSFKLLWSGVRILNINCCRNCTFCRTIYASLSSNNIKVTSTNVTLSGFKLVGHTIHLCHVIALTWHQLM